MCARTFRLRLRAPAASSARRLRGCVHANPRSPAERTRVQRGQGVGRAGGQHGVRCLLRLRQLWARAARACSRALAGRAPSSPYTRYRAVACGVSRRAPILEVDGAQIGQSHGLRLPPRIGCACARLRVVRGAHAQGDCALRSCVARGCRLVRGRSALLQLAQSWQRLPSSSRHGVCVASCAQRLHGCWHGGMG